MGTRSAGRLRAHPSAATGLVQAHATGSDLSWRAPLAEALDQLPADRRRQPRSWEPAGTAGLQSTAPGSQPLLDLASNDYLGLASHPALLKAAGQAMQREGVGAGASRLVSGGRGGHDQLEAALAAWLGRERVLLFPSGFQANLAAVLALADRHTLVLADRLIHHSLLVGIRASGARLQRFAHNQLSDLECRLQQARADQPQRRLLVISESLFSMEGTSPEMAGLSALCEHYGAALLLDEAHALGVLGPGGRGLGHGCSGVSLISGTFGKAFGSGGAFLAGDALVGEWLLQHSGPYRYTTALAPPLAAAAAAALTHMQQQPERASQLLERAERWRDRLEAAGWPRPPGCGPILPLLVGDNSRALALQQQLEQAGLLSVAIRPPTVPAGTARLRLVLRHDLPSGSLERLLKALGTP
ncbi:aminotransferase class I/II-fold pyridoxal phosphate-dependent enzyme [Synechococcus sp. HK05]|uniref:aminotransferase class I/II-fold pyridoxal phosphate-dependent enzyme n=1 Tax=Synechococcus sp. HK05 TaxID=2725975 RepID=UPI001C3898DD|nr:aminotransferase class I/II-fold pyridoxal phosphate-dependent enzyme [Synechococcus sp. HK05]MBV2350117.1 aminotransferase class I/II-fold pyridoxal phosphate-dependent enzyme [Synechococcus sp. HK05]